MYNAYQSRDEIQALIDNGVPESLRLEYKGYKFPDGKIADKDKNELIKDIIAMANAEGGHIILGLAESKGDVPATIQSIECDLSQFDKIQLTIQQSMNAKVRPRLYGVTYHPIAIGENNYIAVLTIPKSPNKPHAVNDGSRDEFFIRHSNGVTHMSVDDIRGQVLSTFSSSGRINAFVKERISRILAKDLVSNMVDGAILTVHIVPLWSMDAGNFVDLTHADQSPQFLKPLFTESYNYRYNTDGFCTYGWSHNDPKKIDSFTQIFRNGAIEAIETRIMNIENERIYNWRRTESYLLDSIKNYSDLIMHHSIPKPWSIFVHLLNAKGYYSTDISSREIDSDIVAAECIVTEDVTVERALKIVFDTISNAFGLRRSTNYDEDGNYRKVK